MRFFCDGITTSFIFNFLKFGMTTYIASSLKALVREKRVPFEMATSRYLSDQEIAAKLIEAETEANDSNTKWLSHDEVFGPLREKYGY
jgi:antitoxin component of RelBE/YafQ-DinJ toxin-antitoxin module